MSWSDNWSKLLDYVNETIVNYLKDVGFVGSHLNAGVIRGVLNDGVVLPPHAPEHEAGGSDEIDLGFLAGVINDAQHGSRAGGTTHAAANGSTAGFMSAAHFSVVDSISAFIATLLDDADAATARTTLGLVAGGAGDIWVALAGDTMTGTLIVPSLEVATAAGSNPVVDFRDADFSGNAFGTLFSPTIAGDAIGRVSPFGVGGLVFNGFAAGTTTVVPLSLAGYSTTTGTTTVPAVLVIGWKSNGTNLRQALSGSEILLQVQSGINTSYTSFAAPLTLYANGNFGLSVQPAARLDIGGGAMRLAEMTAPAAPAANGVLLYAEDNGSGKTRLMALFSSGAAQQVAIQP